jgi:hypothetical protein
VILSSFLLFKSIIDDIYKVQVTKINQHGFLSSLEQSEGETLDSASRGRNTRLRKNTTLRKKH